MANRRFPYISTRGSACTGQDGVRLQLPLLISRLRRHLVVSCAISGLNVYSLIATQKITPRNEAENDVKNAAQIFVLGIVLIRRRENDAENDAKNDAQNYLVLTYLLPFSVLEIHLLMAAY